MLAIVATSSAVHTTLSGEALTMANDHQHVAAGATIYAHSGGPGASLWSDPVSLRAQT